jgi:uncharacterized protein (DUF427 family)
VSKSPGHQKWPHHTVREERVTLPLQVRVNGEVIARSDDVIKVDEDEQPTRYYFARADVPATRLFRSQTTTECPFKGTAHYYSLLAGGQNYRDAVWSYEQPFDEHQGLSGRLAFYNERIPGIVIEPASPGPSNSDH